MGYVNLDEVSKEVHAMEAALKKEVNAEPPQATKVLSFMVKGVTSSLKFVVASYGTSNMTAEELYRRTWNTVSEIEKLGLVVRVITCDGASVNRKFIKMHPAVDGQKGSVIYKTWNPRASEHRVVYFMSDVPHLLKTVRNCLSNSGAHSNSRTLMKNDQVLSWQTIAKIYESREDKDFSRTVKLTASHVYLNSFSRMRVPLALQVLSESVATEVTRKFPEQSELSYFLTVFNKFTDFTNGAHSEHGKRHSNPNLDSYSSSSDPRLNWLLETFLPYIKNWEKEIEEKYAHLKPDIRERYTLSKQTIEGLEITVRSIVEVIGVMIDEEEADYINPRVFCQDPLEAHFSKQREKCGANSHPTLQQALDNDIKILVKGNVARGNKRGNCQALNEQDDSEIFKPLPKRAKPNTKKKLIF